MNTSTAPMVSIVTPVYNGAKYLEECIQSVLNQGYQNWEYLIVDNCSTDSTGDIANRYAALDRRIHVHSYNEFVDVIESHNRALRLISPSSKYCKIVSADDWIYPDCLARMVELAEQNASVGIVGAYTLWSNGEQWRVKFDGLPYYETVVPGRDVCRWHLLGGHHFIGIPTSVLYRADLVRKNGTVFPNSREHADISGFYECLLNTDLGFIHQVLTFERAHDSALSTDARRLSTYVGSQLLDVQRYGRLYLTEGEREKRLEDLLAEYYSVLATAVVNNQGKKFWEYHRAVLAEFGTSVEKSRLAIALCAKIGDLLFNPKLTIEKIIRRRERSAACRSPKQS